MSDPAIETEPEDVTETDSDSVAEAVSSLPDYPTPGKVLRDAREHLQLNRAQVGQGLGLTETAVKNLETNKFDQFPGSVYVRGYLKNFAKLLNLSEEEILSMYEKYCNDHGLETGKSTTEPAAENKDASLTVKMVVISIVLIAVIVGVAILNGGLS